ncbi:MAG: hypothetical protein Tsb002_00620 [Wenzhouxiangellaceae bacterium]
MKQSFRLGVTGALICVAAGVQADEWDWSASIGLEGRYFLQSGRWPGQDRDLQGSVLLAPELRWRNQADNQRISIIPFARIDSLDEERTHTDLREAYWAYEGDGWELLAGINKVFWGVAESRHLVDIINQSDLLEDPDEEDKLGQPMVNLAVQRDWGYLNFYLLPYFRQRNFPGREGRLRTALPVAADQREFTKGADEDDLDWALRYSHYFGSFDVGLSWFHGTSREPRFRLDPVNDVLIPVYDEIDQIGVDVQYTGDAWLWKLEAIARDGFTDNFIAVTGGFEYTLFQISDTAADLGLLMEYHHDGRAVTEPFTLFDDDLFIGMRLSLNDIQNTSVLGGIVYDLSSQASFINIEAERRIGDSLSAEFRLRIFAGAAPNNPDFAFERDDYAQILLTQYF